MLTYNDHHLKLIRDFTDEQFLAHVTLVESVYADNDFGNIGVEVLLKNYLDLVHKIQSEHQNGKQEFQLTKNEVILYDLVVEIVRICYKYPFSNTNDWEEEFK